MSRVLSQRLQNTVFQTPVLHSVSSLPPVTSSHLRLIPTSAPQHLNPRLSCTHRQFVESLRFLLSFPGFLNCALILVSVCLLAYPPFPHYPYHVQLSIGYPTLCVWISQLRCLDLLVKMYHIVGGVLFELILNCIKIISET